MQPSIGSSERTNKQWDFFRFCTRQLQLTEHKGYFFQGLLSEAWSLNFYDTLAHINMIILMKIKSLIHTFKKREIRRVDPNQLNNF